MRKHDDGPPATPVPWMHARYQLKSIERAAETLQEAATRHPELATVLGAFPGLAGEAARAIRERLILEDL